MFDAFGCDLWLGRRAGNGYALLPNGRVAHKAAWEAAHGPLPPGLFLDHACRRRHCVRLAHLEPVTKEENERRKSSRYRLLHLVTCPEGHRYDTYGLTTPEGGKVCSVCSKVEK